jgi:hypothetical protein
LKLTAEVLGIQIDAAQGGDDSDLAAEQAKLANNINLDTAAAGQASTAVSFDESTWCIKCGSKAFGGFQQRKVLYSRRIQMHSHFKEIDRYKSDT